MVRRVDPNTQIPTASDGVRKLFQANTKRLQQLAFAEAPKLETTGAWEHAEMAV